MGICAPSPPHCSVFGRRRPENHPEAKHRLLRTDSPHPHSPSMAASAASANRRSNGVRFRHCSPTMTLRTTKHSRTLRLKHCRRRPGPPGVYETPSHPMAPLNHCRPRHCTEMTVEGPHEACRPAVAWDLPIIDSRPVLVVSILTYPPFRGEQSLNSAKLAEILFRRLSAVATQDIGPRKAARSSWVLNLSEDVTVLLQRIDQSIVCASSFPSSMVNDSVSHFACCIVP